MRGEPCPCGALRYVPWAAFERGSGDPLLGRCVLGGFVLLGPRAFGARSAVHDAIDLTRGAPCVVKVVRLDGGSVSAAPVLEHEAAVLRSLPAGIAARALEVGVESLPPADPAHAPVEVACLALELVDGRSLAEAAAAEPLRAAASSLGVIARLHEAGWAHGDLTPAHVTLGPDEGARVLDLGSAAPIDRGAARSAPADGATPAYAAPERAATGPTVASDLYAWARSIAASAPEAVDHPALATALRTALAAEPGARPRTARALLAALRP